MLSVVVNINKRQVYNPLAPPPYNIKGDDRTDYLKDERKTSHNLMHKAVLI